MAIPTPAQTIVNTASDSSLNKIYSSDLQSLAGAGAVGAVYLTTTQEYVTNYYSSAKPGGVSGEVQFNDSNKFSGDTGFTYDPDTDSLTVTGNVNAGNIKTDNILYSNGTAWNFGDSTYGNTNVISLLSSFGSHTISTTGNIATGNITVTATHGTLVFGDATATGSPGLSSTTSVTITANRAGTTKELTFNTSGDLSVPGNITATKNISAGNLTVSGTTNLGAVGNLTITGGTSGQVLQTDGAGNLSWHTVSGGGTTPSLDAVTAVGATSSTAISITDATESTNYHTGALTVDGGVGIAGVMHIAGHVTTESTYYAGHLADFSTWNAPKFIGRDAGATYIQGALVNTNMHGSADWVAYGDQSDDANGWCDMGFTGTSFNDSTYTVTKENDGYLLVQGMPGQGGNLVLATGEKGGSTHRDIVFATGGFLQENEKMRLNHEDNTLYVGAHGEVGGTNVVNINTNGNIIASKSVSIGTFVKLTPGTAPNSPTEGMVYYDSTSHKLKVYTGSSWETITSA